MKRVVITGMAGITSLGSDFNTIAQAMREGRTGIAVMPDWQEIAGLHTALGGPVTDFSVPEHYTRKQCRAMGRVAKLAVVATERALNDAGLREAADLLGNGEVGIAYGSCAGSSQGLVELVSIEYEKTTANLTATTYVKAMSHTCAVNAAIFFGVTGRIIPTTSACTSGSQAIGYAYEAIKYGQQKVMIAGGAEELCPSQAAVFDSLYATSQMNSEPERSPRPFDKDRDGLVIGEGAGTLILEEYEHAKARGATIYAEVKGFATNCDARHITQPTTEYMAKVMQAALDDAGIKANEVGYISAHGTSTERGDQCESQAVHQVFGDKTPISSLKGYFGHTLGACGALEAWLSIEMMRQNAFAANVNLDDVDSNCAPIDYIRGEPRKIETDVIVSNNFAFGGINTSLVFTRV